ncbi:MAG: lipid A core--O-antigen ligase [Polyangiaceae bacterium]|nr:lipid A core--O-antigen ligase [Polyangiaceae bacterium]
MESASRFAGDMGVQIVAGLVALVVIASALAIGTVHVQTLVVIAPIAFAAAALGILHDLKRRGGTSIAIPAAIATVLAAITLLQAIPLPISWLERIAPANADIWARALMPFGEAGPRFASISLDPGASVVEALKWSSYAALFTAAATVSARYGATMGIGVVFVSAILVATATIAHGLLGLKDVYGIYKPSVELPPWHVGPLINTNTLAGYLNLGVLSGMSLVLTRSRDMPRWVIAAGIAFLIGVSVTSASRGGLITLLVGILLLAALLGTKISRKSEDDSAESRASARWLLGGTLVAGALLAVLGGTRDTWSELYDKNLGKLEMVLWAKPLLEGHFFLGIGRGAFESVFPAHRTVPGHVVYAYLENFPAQWLVEWGVPIGALALLAFAWTLRPSRLGARHSGLAAAAFTGVVVVLLQNLADLSLEIPAVCYGLVVTIGSLWGDNLRSRAGIEYEQRRSQRMGRMMPAFVFSSGLVIAAAAFRFGHPDVGTERNWIKQAYEGRDFTNPAIRAELRASLRTAMLRHPGEPYFPLVGALVATRTNSESAIPWLQRSLERSPVNPRAHLLLAEVLGTHGAKRQALLELRFAIEQDAALIDVAARLALRFSTKYDDLNLAIPEGPRAAMTLDSFGRHAEAAKLPELRSRFDAEAIRRDPSIFGPRIREAEVRLAAMKNKDAKGGLCEDRDKCAREIQEHAAALERSHPTESVSARIAARLKVLEGKPEEADALLAERCVHVRDRAECMRVRVEAASKISGTERIDLAAREYLGASCLSSTACADAATFVAVVREQRGDAASAIALYARAAREEPTEARWLALADAASRGGAHAQCVDALERLAAKRGGMDEAIRKRIIEERARALGKSAH